MRTYRVTIVGKTPLIMHHDNIEWADQMEAWKNDPHNRGASRPGDDRTPAFRWIGCLYHDGTKICIPTDNIIRSFMSGGARILVGRGQKTFKAQTQSGILAPDLFWPLLVDGNEIPVAPIFDGMQARTWEQHNVVAGGMGFTLFVKRAGMPGGKKHIRVRPKFDRWSVSGRLIVLDEAITGAVLQQIADSAGEYVGLCDWRPGGKTPGPHGMFTFSFAQE